MDLLTCASKEGRFYLETRNLQSTSEFVLTRATSCARAPDQSVACTRTHERETQLLPFTYLTALAADFSFAKDMLEIPFLKDTSSAEVSSG